MNYHNDQKSSRGSMPRQAALLIAVALSGLAAPGIAQDTIRIAASGADLNDAESLARVRREVTRAARAHCETGGVAAIHGNEARRCRERFAVDAERQIRARTGTMLASRHAR